MSNPINSEFTGNALFSPQTDPDPATSIAQKTSAIIGTVSLHLEILDEAPTSTASSVPSLATEKGEALEVIDTPAPTSTSPFLKLSRDAQIRILSYLKLSEMLATIVNQETYQLSKIDPEVPSVISYAAIEQLEWSMLHLGTPTWTLSDEESFLGQFGVRPTSAQALCCPQVTSQEFGEFTKHYQSAKALSLLPADSLEEYLPSLLKLSQLQKLEITDHDITPEFLDSIQNLPINNLRIVCCSIYSLEPLASFPLTHLTLNNRAITQSDITVLSKLPFLTHLTFCGCKIDSSNTDLSKLKNVRHLIFKNLETTDNHLEQLQGLSLKHLEVNRSSITDVGLTYLTGMPLEYLDIACTSITDAGLASLEGMPLKFLNLGKNEEISSRGLSRLEKLPLQSLFLNECSTIIDIAALQNLPLETLDLSRCKLLTSSQMKNLRQMPLKKLFLDNCYCMAKLSGENRLQDFVNMKHLQELSLCNVGVKKSEVDQLQKEFPHLMIFDC